MAAHPPPAPRQQQLPRLFIPGGQQQGMPMSFNDPTPGALFSPALPTGGFAHQQHPHHHQQPPHHFQHPLQTPMQQNFGFPQPPNAPGRPHHAMHRAHPSMIQLAAAGILPPPGMLPPIIPMTPLGNQTGFPGMPMMMPPHQQMFMPKSRRTQSVSTGGPPKAVLGGPQRKVSPFPPGTAATVTPTPTPPPIAAAALAPVVVAPVKVRKVVVNLPKETVTEKVDSEEDGEKTITTRPEWARTPLPLFEADGEKDVKYPELVTAEAFPPDSWRHHLPPTVDVFLPGKAAWDSMKQQIIEEKLERLGVERGTGSGMSTVPHIHAPHARAASISSPADPALLFFKLNKLQQSQNNSATHSLSASPQPSLLSISPSLNGQGLPSRMLPGRNHGHSMSLAQPPSFQQNLSLVYNPTPGFNPFGPTAVLGSDQVIPLDEPQEQEVSSSQALAQPDFMLGFGVDIPEEEEPEEDVVPQEVAAEDSREEEELVNLAVDEDTDIEQEDGDVSTVAQSRIHSRHVSRLSAALSLVSVGRADEPVYLDGGEADMELEMPAPVTMPVPAGVDGTDADAVDEWTGSEDLRTGVETSDDESISEWSNPSDEERARKNRLHRRTIRRAAQLKRELEIPRRLPNFPRPPDIYRGEVDDDMISNPSEEERMNAAPAFPRPGSTMDDQGARPLPPVPHSRSASAQFSHHDPALAHSRDPSEHYPQPGGLRPPPHPMPTAMPHPTTFSAMSAPRKDSLTLNPFAKPFVFGAGPSTFTPPPPSAPAHTSSFALSNAVQSHSNLHSRAPSLGKPLNAAAQEFKPGGFTFKPPPGVPQLTFASVDPLAGPLTASTSARPLPVPPKSASPARAVQGREKRQRRASGDSDSFADTSNDQDDDDADGQDTMHSFKFPVPAPVSASKFRHSAPASPPDSAGLSAPKPFTFSGFSTNSAATFGHGDGVQQHYAVSDSALSRGHGNNDDDEPPLAESSPRGVTGATELPFPPTSSRPRRAPIPLDFKHPVSTNTVPAGLFKNLNNTINNENEERTRRTVRSRLSSRDIFEHSPRPSLDDLNVPPISASGQSQRAAGGRNRLFTDPGLNRDGDDDLMVDDIFSMSRRRRSSMPTRRSPDSEDDDEDDDVSIGPMNLSRRVEMQQYEQRLEQLLDEKMDDIKETLQASTSQQGLNSSTETAIAEVLTLFRSQLQDAAAKSLEDNSAADARGELDFEVVKGLIEQGHRDTRVALQRDIVTLLAGRDNTADIQSLVQDLSSQTLNHVAAATSQLTHHIRSLEKSSSEREAIVLDVVAGLTPHLAAMRSEPIDYEGLTMQLTQAVKPHISQLIDLASDKRETANLIVDRLLPILPTLSPAASPLSDMNMDDIVGRLVSEVSDLVVERLDSRLAVRDKAFNVDVVTDRVAQSVGSHFAELKTAVAELAAAQATAPVPDVSSLRQGVLDLLSDLPDRLATATDALSGVRADLKSEQARLATKEDPTFNIVNQLHAKVDRFTDEQQKLVEQNNEFSEFCQDIIKHINSLPEAMLEATKVLQNAHADIIERDTSAKDGDEIRRLMQSNSELSSQLAKARGAHGQVRVEKDMLSERLRGVEADREKMSAQMEQMQGTVVAKSAESAALEARNRELEEALAQALERIKSSDVIAQTNLERIANIEKSVAALGDEKYQLKTKADAAEIKLAYAVREKEALADDLATLRQQFEESTSQQSQWDELRRTNENLQALAQLVSQNDNEELKELRRTRDRFRNLETEHAALQRRLKEQDNKVLNSERTAQTARQSLSQAQQRAMEWEKRAKDYEHELESTRTRLDQSEQSQAQLDADYSLVKLQLEERDAEERLAKDRESKLRDQIAAMEESMARMRAETDQANTKAATATASAASAIPASRPPVSSRLRQNGYTHPTTIARPDSRASTVFGDSRVNTPTPLSNGAHAAPNIRPASPVQPSVWDSVHAPRSGRNMIRAPVTPKAKKPMHAQPFYPRAASPTPSTASAAPTLGDDGWWA
ncbi:hypothetical protein EUX98_g1584 [Antrodiella citrinella]|uniref:Uncharacterized protein n=1 Tax=Antrodiella citrinella TaxID=2447956 RepID=A0A4S4N9I4_9APHY|nr:hypothetical protein EUX98_g1584 [Antrodiella citrinella]